ncbi:MAG: hypothetical protein ACRENG_19360, partial [bacterium]
INYTENENTIFDPYAKQTTYMDQWQGYYGNPELGYERTIQYEIGVDKNIANRFRLDVTGYYKDASNEARPNTQLFSATNFYNRAIMLSNSGYSDVRGLESGLETLFDGPLNFGLTHEVYWSWRGGVGHTSLYEPLAQRPDVPRGYDREKGAWSSFNRLKGWVNLAFGQNGGPEFFGSKPLRDVNVYAYFWWRQGEPYTYHGPGDVSTRPNNRRWFSYYQVNLKAAKGFPLVGVRAEISCEARNLLNGKFYRLFSESQLSVWHERTDLPERERLPQHNFSGEPNEWGWYSYEVPPRQVYFQLRFDF